MSFTDKLKFWKKKEKEPDMGDLFGDTKEVGPPGADLPPGPDMSMSPDFSISEPTVQPLGTPTAPPSLIPAGAATMQQPGSLDKDIELISAKLDAIKAMLDSIVQRLDKIERKDAPKW